MAGAQLEYCKTVRKILKQQLSDYLCNGVSTASENEIEATALYGEYAIDFATQSVRYALIAALKAIDLQMSADEHKEEKKMKQSKWILPVICACAGFVAGLTTGISILEYIKKVSFKRLREDISDEIPEPMEEERNNE